MTSDPSKYFVDRLDLVAELRPLLLNRSVLPGDDYSRYASAHIMLTKTAINAGAYLTKYIGGFDISRFRRPAGVAQPPAPIQVRMTSRPAHQA
jgi:hypothetical protein